MAKPEFETRLSAIEAVFANAKNANRISLQEDLSPILRFSSFSSKSSASADQTLVLAVLARLKTEKTNTLLPSSDALEDLVRLQLEGVLPYDANNPLSLLIAQTIDVVAADNGVKSRFKISNLSNK